jgi:hypothetical protein
LRVRVNRPQEEQARPGTFTARGAAHTPNAPAFGQGATAFFHDATTVNRLQGFRLTAFCQCVDLYYITSRPSFQALPKQNLKNRAGFAFLIFCLRSHAFMP